MKNPPSASADSDWLKLYLSKLDPPATERPAFRAVLSPAEEKAERTARVARELIEAETEERQATTARLRAARLGKDANSRVDPTQGSARQQGGPGYPPG